MTKLISALTIVLMSVCACHAERAAIGMTAEQLARDKDQLFGEKVEVDGCIYVHNHGMQIAPCTEHDWRQIIPVTDPHDKLSEAFASIKQLPFGSLRAHFVGRVVDDEYDWPKKGIHRALEIERISNVQSTGP